MCVSAEHFYLPSPPLSVVILEGIRTKVEFNTVFPTKVHFLPISTATNRGRLKVEGRRGCFYNTFLCITHIRLRITPLYLCHAINYSPLDYMSTYISYNIVFK